MNWNREFNKDATKNITLTLISIFLFVYAYHLIELGGYKWGGLILLNSIMALFIKEIKFVEDK